MALRLLMPASACQIPVAAQRKALAQSQVGFSIKEGDTVEVQSNAKYSDIQHFLRSRRHGTAARKRYTPY